MLVSWNFTTQTSSSLVHTHIRSLSVNLSNSFKILLAESLLLLKGGYGLLWVSRGQPRFEPAQQVTLAKPMPTIIGMDMNRIWTRPGYFIGFFYFPFFSSFFWWFWGGWRFNLVICRTGPVHGPSFFGGGGGRERVEPLSFKQLVLASSDQPDSAWAGLQPVYRE